MPSPLNDNLQDLARNLGDLVAPYALREFYAQGTFTPTFAGTSTAGTFTYSLQEGAYTRIGNTVFFILRVGISAISVAPTGNMIIAGLPLTASASAPPAPTTLAFMNQIDYPAGAVELTARIGQGENFIRLAYSQDNGSNQSYPAASFTNASASLSASGLYFVD